MKINNFRYGIFICKFSVNNLPMVQDSFGVVNQPRRQETPIVLGLQTIIVEER